MIVLFVTVLLTLGLCLWLASARTPLLIKDHPNKRSLHVMPTPHTGGLAILASIGIAWAWYAGQHAWPVALSGVVFPLLLIGTVSFLDDVRSIIPQEIQTVNDRVRLDNWVLCDRVRLDNWVLSCDDARQLRERYFLFDC